tara:strand:+ start:376 stop:1059 length:684 start_codon:yes stop_codon:yes gene_type:complete
METFHNASGKKIEVEDVPLFSTPIIVTKFNDHEKYEIESFDKVDRRPEFWDSSVNTSFPGMEKDDPYISQETLDKIRNSILEQVKDVFEIYNMPRDIVMYNFWYNAYYEGQGQELHNHLGEDNYNPFWCGVYFAKNCFNSQFKFRRSDHALRTQQPFNFHQTRLVEYYRDMWPSGIPNGYICLFPPHLLHKVVVGKENRDKMRLSFSFNIHLGIPKSSSHIDKQILS